MKKDSADSKDNYGWGCDKSHLTKLNIFQDCNGNSENLPVPMDAFIYWCSYKNSPITTDSNGNSTCTSCDKAIFKRKREEMILYGGERSKQLPRYCSFWDVEKNSFQSSPRDVHFEFKPDDFCYLTNIKHTKIYEGFLGEFRNKYTIQSEFTIPFGDKYEIIKPSFPIKLEGMIDHIKCTYVGHGEWTYTTNFDYCE